MEDKKKNFLNKLRENFGGAKGQAAEDDKVEKARKALIEKRKKSLGY